MKKDLICFKQNKLYTNSKKRDVTSPELTAQIVALNEELQKIGYTLSPDFLDILSEDEVKRIYKEVIPEIVKEEGLDKTWKVMYPNFPDEVINKSFDDLKKEQEEVYNQVRNITGQLPKADQDSDYIILKPINEEEFLNIPTRFLQMAGNLSLDQEKILEWFMLEKKEGRLNFIIPDQIPNKERMAKMMMISDDIKPKDINDVLRYAFYILTSSTRLEKVKKEVNSAWRKVVPNPRWRKLKSLPMIQRKRIMGMIEEMVEKKSLYGTIPDAKKSRFYGDWMLLNERIHPQHFKTKYPKASEFFHTLLTNELSKKYITWNAKIQAMYDEGKPVVEITQEIAKRPGELIRRFDSLIRRGVKEGTDEKVFDIFLNTDGMNNKTLIELYWKYVNQKGFDGDIPRKVKLLTGVEKRIPDLPKLNINVVEVFTETLGYKILDNVKKNSEKEDNTEMEGKKVWIDPDLAQVPIPYIVRDSYMSIPRGTKFKLGENTKRINIFCQWIQDKTPEDLDLYGILLSDDGTGVMSIGWNTSYKSCGNICIHSGDVLNIEGNCQETIQIKVDGKKDDWRYVIASVRNYKGRTLDSLDAWVGFDELEDDKSKKLKKNQISQSPKKRFKLAGNISNVYAFLVDRWERTISFIMVADTGLPVYTFEGSRESNVVKAMKQEGPITSLDLLKTWWTAKGTTMTEDKSEADIKVELNDVLNDGTLQNII